MFSFLSLSRSSSFTRSEKTETGVSESTSHASDPRSLYGTRMIAPSLTASAHPMPAFPSAAGGSALRQRRPMAANQNHHLHRRFGILPNLQQQLKQQRRGNELATSEARRDETLIAAAGPSSWQGGNSTNATRSGRKNNSTATRASSASASASSASSSMPSSSALTSASRGRELLDAIADLPWQRVAVWAVVAWAAYQLKDFFGVRNG